MLIKSVIKATALALILSVTGFGYDGVTKRIKFAKGKTSTTIAYSVIRGEVDTYILGANKCKTMTVKITSVEKNAAFTIEGPGGEYLAGAGEMDDAMSFSGKLPTTGDYRILVGGTRGNATYRLTVSIR